MKSVFVELQRSSKHRECFMNKSHSQVCVCLKPLSSMVISKMMTDKSNTDDKFIKQVN